MESDSCARGEVANSLSAEAINIPDNLIVYEILVRLPVKSILRFRCVCKHWNSLTREKHFEDRHMERSKIRFNSNYTSSSGILFRRKHGHSLCYFGEDNYQKIFDFSSFPGDGDGYSKPQISNSCHGLICVYNLKSIHLVNPSTDECIELPPSSAPPTRNVALVYDVLIHKYKVARLFGRPNGLKLGCEILTLGPHQSWKDIGDTPIRVRPNSVVVVDNGGRIYWPTCYSVLESQEFAISLDIQSETFDAIMPPKGCLHNLIFPYIAELEGYFCLFYHHQCIEEDGPSILHLWRLKDCKSRRWADEYKISLDLREHFSTMHLSFPALHPKSIRCGKILLSDIQNRFHCWCDLENGTFFNKLVVLDHFCAGSYFETLLSPVAIIRDKDDECDYSDTDNSAN